MTKTIPKLFVTRFFQLITTRQFAEAERILERIKQKITLSERNRGYYQALYGMLLTQRNNDDRYAFLTNLNMSTKKELHESRREFLRQSEHRLHADYDRGFFSAWADYMRILAKLESLSLAPIPTSSKNDVQLDERIEGTEAGKKEVDEIQTDEERKQAGVEKREAEEEKAEKTIETGSKETVEPRQSSLSDFSIK